MVNNFATFKNVSGTIILVTWDIKLGDFPYITMYPLTFSKIVHFKCQS